MRLVTFSLLGLSLTLLSKITLAQATSAASRESSYNREGTVRVITISQDGLARGANDLLQPTLARLDGAASFHPDIACLPELFSNRPPEPVPGTVTESLAAWAREHSSYVVFGLRTKKDDREYNSAILLDRKGQVVGEYDDLYPDPGQLKGGITPGKDLGPPLFKTDFGTIGILLCFDVDFRDGWRRLKEHGAQIVFWPSAYPAARQLPALALSNEYYIVSSTMSGSAHIYDITGEPLASTGRYQEWTGAALPLGKRLFEVDFNAPKVQEIQQKYGSRVEVAWYHDSDWFTLASLDPNLSTEHLIREYGLTPLDEYIRSSAKLIDQARVKAEGKVQAAK